MALHPVCLPEIVQCLLGDMFYIKKVLPQFVEAHLELPLVRILSKLGVCGK